MEMDSSMGKIYTDAKEHDPLHLRQGRDGQVQLLRQVRDELAALLAEADAKAEGDWTVVKRTDGTMQWAYDGKPLYHFIQDKKPGDVTGDGKGDGTWHVVKADAM